MKPNAKGKQKEDKSKQNKTKERGENISLGTYQLQIRPF
jgi:hypothetical protein